MKTIISVVSVVSCLTVATAQSIKPRYLKALAENSRLIGVVNSTYLRAKLRPETDAPTLVEYLESHGATTLPQNVTEQQLAEQMMRTTALTQEWADKYYPELSEEEVFAVLSNDEKLRAKTVALTILFNSSLRSGRPISLEEAVVIGAELTTIIMAVDADVEINELQAAIRQLEEGTLEIVYSASDHRFGIGRQTVAYGTKRAYLSRPSRFRHSQLPAPLIGVLQELGYTDSEMIDKISPMLAQVLVNDQIRPELDNSLIDLPASVAIDLLTEPGIVGGYVLTPYQLEAFDTPLEYLADELEIDAGSLDHLNAKLAMTDDEENWLRQIVAILDDRDSPATLFQVTQLRRLGFSFAEIAKLSFNAREAIIVSGYENREIFSERHELSEVNSLVEKTGPLVYYLARLGYDVNQVKRHALLDATEIDSDLQEMRIWQALQVNAANQQNNSK